MLTGKQKRFLRKEAHHLSPIFQVGKQGVNDNLIAQLNDVLEKRELIKINILQNVFEDKEEIAQQIVRGTNAELVQIIGNIVILYKPSEENKQIELP
ncbi:MULTISPECIES: ribosome assembly RNA-binding protein YhbY [Allobacillus]|uniref:Ribosome assembly RNA-binding protein YhbY n=1 Tax=Allobacillus halotolerans TaxID=570278 RepID=A0ABS6GNJ3_9BACI|nr:MULTISPECIES: ribosome assembly RNA-binding protein YhbY [Allobacillus]MBU6080689.1 ribosome assembly RNA-binding protein YhbY [Allobacillus halotolerans]TSJ68272.1 ribosome assembly RNA-binding protein YhbY [Allobacillus sp. SKP2-8]